MPLPSAGRLRSRPNLITLACLVVLTSVALTAPVAGSPAAAGAAAVGSGVASCTEDLFDESVRVKTARSGARDAFAEAADANGLRSAELAETAEDHAAWLDRCGQLFFVDRVTAPAEVGAAERSVTTTPAALAAPLDRTFSLSSRPGSRRTIYLDFRGGVVTRTGWNGQYGTGSSITVAPYSTSAPVDTRFSTSELTDIQTAWKIVAEDFAPFDVNVTTAWPGQDALTRNGTSDQTYGSHVRITNAGPLFEGCGCSGLAYVDVFSRPSGHATYQPAWVFADGAGRHGKGIGETVSHEVGHNFGLSHDGTATSAYHRGAAPWAPIMGTGVHNPVSQWSKGEYPGANNQQDDLAIIAKGAPRLSDDHADSAAGATALTPGARVAGRIQASTDRDVFSFDGSGPTTVTVALPEFSNLDTSLTIADASGTPLAVVDPTVRRVSAEVASGLDATWTGRLPSSDGPFTATVRGTGYDARTGSYSSYGSLGTYTISVQTQAAPVRVGAQRISAVAGRPLARALTAAGSRTDLTWRVATGSALPRWATLSPSGRISGTPPGPGTATFDVIATDGVTEAEGRVTVAVAPAPAAAPSSTPGATPVSVADRRVRVPAQTVRARAGTRVDHRLRASGGAGRLRWAVTKGTLPKGLRLTPAGRLVGRSTATMTSRVTVTAVAGTSSSRRTARAVITVRVVPRG